MKLILITLVAVVVFATLACGESKEEIFQAEMREWFATNVGDGVAIQRLFERKSEDEILESVDELKAIEGTDWNKYALIINLQTMALANEYVDWAIKMTKVDWVEIAEAAGKDSIQIPECIEGVTHGKGNIYLDDYIYDHDALTLACEFQVQASNNLYRLSLNFWREEIFGCESELSPCYGENPIFH